MQACKNLKNIELVNNKLTELQSELFDPLMPLSQFIIDNNPINEIPAGLFKVESLTSIILSRLNIEKLPENWVEDTDSVNIKSVQIVQTRLSMLPNDLIIANKSLEQLIFQGVHLIVPENESQWPLMMIDLNTVISLYCPTLLSVEEATSIFKQFDYDNNNILDYKELQHFNAFIFKKFPRLESFASNKPDELTPIAKDEKEQDEQVQLLPNASLSDNSMTKMFFLCKQLTYLDFSFQAIKKIPGAIKMLKQLKVLKLKYCVYLEQLSPKLGALKLNELDLTGCISLKTPPIEIQKRGVTSILAYLNRLTDGSVQCKRTKLMLQGLGSAGKTSLVNAMINNIYQKNVQSPDVTDGISISDWNVKLKNEESLSFSVFDFAGQVNKL